MQFDLLGDELIIFFVLPHLLTCSANNPARDLCRLARTCKRFHWLILDCDAVDSAIWKPLSDARADIQDWLQYKPTDWSHRKFLQAFLLRKSIISPTLSRGVHPVIYFGENSLQKTVVRLDGFGICILNRHNYFVGNFKHDRMEGAGLLKRCSCRECNGPYTAVILSDSEEAHFSIYVGEFHKNVRHGIGNLRTSQKSVVGGLWIDGQLVSGLATYNFSGDIYNGQIRRNRKQGDGIFCFAETGLRYEGEFLDDYFWGRGRLIWPNGDQYFGTFYRGRRIGCGLLILATGERFRQFWQDNRSPFVFGDAERFTEQRQLSENEWNEFDFTDYHFG